MLRLPRLYNSECNVIYWFYTSCMCQSSPAQAAKATGEVRLNLGRAGTKPGGYDLGFFPAGGEFEAGEFVSSGERWRSG